MAPRGRLARPGRRVGGAGRRTASRALPTNGGSGPQADLAPGAPCRVGGRVPQASLPASARKAHQRLSSQEPTVAARCTCRSSGAAVAVAAWLIIDHHQPPHHHPGDRKGRSYAQSGPSHRRGGPMCPSGVGLIRSHAILGLLHPEAVAVVNVAHKPLSHYGFFLPPLRLFLSQLTNVHISMNTETMRQSRTIRNANQAPFGTRAGLM